MMTPAERARMRDTLRTALGTTLLPGATLEHPGHFTRPSRPDIDLAGRFRAELETLGGFVHEVTPERSARQIIGGILDAQSTRSVLAWNDASLAELNLAHDLTAMGATLHHLTPGALDSPERRTALGTLAVGLTGAMAGLAETGSLVLVSGPGRPRLASLLPPVHIAVLRRMDLCASLADLLNARPELATAGANFVCITGPSRTADIEHTLSRGVHGPREVHVVLI